RPGISICVEPACQPDWVAIQIPPPARSIISKAVLIQARLDIELLTWHPQILNDSAGNRTHLTKRAIAGRPDYILAAIGRRLWRANAVVVQEINQTRARGNGSYGHAVQIDVIHQSSPLTIGLFEQAAIEIVLVQRGGSDRACPD